jgi:hypothetical protein
MKNNEKQKPLPKLQRKKFVPGVIKISLNEEERKWLLSWVKSFWATEKDTFDSTNEVKYEEYQYFAEKLHHQLHSGKVKGSRYTAKGAK